MLYAEKCVFSGYWNVYQMTKLSIGVQTQIKVSF